MAEYEFSRIGGGGLGPAPLCRPQGVHTFPLVDSPGELDSVPCQHEGFFPSSDTMDLKGAAMVCKWCGKPMTYREGEDEKSDGEMIGFAIWECECGQAVHDYEDEFKWPPETHKTNAV